jgi:hypothetical protein
MPRDRNDVPLQLGDRVTLDRLLFRVAGLGRPTARGEGLLFLESVGDGEPRVLSCPTRLVERLAASA